VVEREAKLITAAAEFHTFKHHLGCVFSMQPPIEVIRSMFSFLIVINALFLQGVWIFIGRKGQQEYIDDLTNFRAPQSAFSRLYGWRVSKTSNVLAEGLVFEAILIAAIIGLGVLAGDVFILGPLIPLVALVVIMSMISIGQIARRVSFITQEEDRITNLLKNSEFKIEEAKNIVDDLSNQGQFADGRIWFVMFRISARQDPIGWAVRDVLIEKGKKMVRQMQAEATRKLSEDGPSPSEGSGIE